jgi:hypothetical protein
MAKKNDGDYVAFTKAELKKEGRITVSNEDAAAIEEAHGPAPYRKVHGSDQTVLDYSAEAAKAAEASATNMERDNPDSEGSPTGPTRVYPENNAPLGGGSPREQDKPQA